MRKYTLLADSLICLLLFLYPDFFFCICLKLTKMLFVKKLLLLMNIWWNIMGILIGYISSSAQGGGSARNIPHTRVAQWSGHAYSVDPSCGWIAQWSGHAYSVAHSCGLATMLLFHLFLSDWRSSASNWQQRAVQISPWMHHTKMENWLYGNIQTDIWLYN